ncbi:ribosomal protein L7/L12 C-terminal domain-containing protein, partial [Schizophyllum amplum]
RPLSPPSARFSTSPRALQAAAAAKPASETIDRIVDDISKLTLLQAADLVTALKDRLNIQEIAMPSAAAPAAAAPAAEETVKPKEKTIFNVKLESFDAAAKPKIIREVKAIVPNLTLIDAKKFVEGVPKILKENVTKEDAEKLQKAFEALGAVVKLE